MDAMITKLTKGFEEDTVLVNTGQMFNVIGGKYKMNEVVEVNLVTDGRFNCQYYKINKK